MIIFNVDTNVAIYGGTRYWAERGLIHIEDQNDAYEAISVTECLARLEAMQDMVITAHKDPESVKAKRFLGGGKDRVDETQRFIEQMVDIVRQAREQGTPDDASARRDLARRRKQVMYTGSF